MEIVDKDAIRESRGIDDGFAFLVVNIPAALADRKRKPYTSEQFKEGLIARIEASDALKRLAETAGDWCVAIKKIGTCVEEVSIYSSVPLLLQLQKAASATPAAL